MLLLLTPGFLIGLVLGSYVPYLPLTVLSLLIVTALGLTVLEARSRVTARQGLWIYGFILLGVLWWMLATTSLQATPLPIPAESDPVTVRGTIVEPPRQHPERTVIVVAVSALRDGERTRAAGGRLRVSWRAPDRVLGQGDVIEFTARVRTPWGTRNPGGFDYGAYLTRKGIVGVASVRGPGAILLLASGQDRLRWAGWHALDRWRERIRQAATRSLDGPALGIYLGLIIGEQGFVSPEVRDQFMATGTVHILSISGSHLGLIAFLSFFLSRELCRRLPAAWLLALSRWLTPNRAAVLLTLPPVTFYAFLAGGEIATVRSLIMIVVCLVAVWHGYAKNLLHAVAAAALLLLAHDPQAIYDISFQLSFVSVLAIALVLRWRGTLDQAGHVAAEPLGPRVRRWLRDYAWITGGVTLATLPLVAYHFNQIAWLGLLANAIVVPLAGLVVVPVGLVSGWLVLLLDTETLPMAQLNQGVLMLTAGLVGLLARIPAAEWHVASPAVPAIVLFYAVLAGARPSLRPWTRRTAVLGAAFLVAWWAWSPRLGVDGETLRVTFLDVGQGDATVIELPEGQTILIDGGAAYERLDMGRAVVGPYLWDRGIRRLDLVLGTHPQLDHLGGLPWILRSFAVEEYWGNGEARDLVFYHRLRETMRRRDLREHRASAGRVLLSTPSCRLLALNPPAPSEPGAASSAAGRSGSLLNNLSVVTRLDCGPHSFLFAADIEAGAMARLARQGAPLDARVVKVPHHGARSSLDVRWIDQVGAELGVVSVGRTNPYGHPAPDVLDAYARAGTALRRTDEEGAVLLTATFSSPVATISSSRLSRPKPIRLDALPVHTEVENLSRIWTQWMG